MTVITNRVDVSAMVADLGASVERSWASAGYEVGAFSQIAQTALSESDLLHGGAAPILQWFIGEQQLPQQRLRYFGQPPINVFWNDRFFIEVLTWISSTHAIHEHAFAGAFALLDGFSFHARYGFQSAGRLSTELALGKLTFEDYEFLQPGSVRPIPPGSDLIHVNLHLDSPSFTVVVRTRTMDAFKPQFRYYDCGLALDETHEPEPFATKLALLRSVASFDRPAFWKMCDAALADADAWFSLMVLQLGAKFREREPERYAHLVDVVSTRHGDTVDVLDVTARRRAWESAGIRRRGGIPDADGRTFVNLMLTAPSSEVMARLAAERFPNVPLADMVAKWVPDLYPFPL